MYEKNEELNNKTFHDFLINAMQALGLKANKDGVCAGFSAIGMFSFFNNNFENFKELVNQLEQHRLTNPEKLRSLLKSIREKCKVNEAEHITVEFDKEEQALGQLRGLLESIEFTFSPEKYPQWFSTRQNQVAWEKMAEILIPETGVKKIVEYGSIYNEKELISYFTKLNSLAKVKKIDFTLAF